MRAVPYGGFGAPHVVQNEGDMRQTSPKVGKEQVAHVVVGGDGRIERAARAFHEPNEPLEPMCFERDAPDAFGRFGDGVLGEFVTDGALALGDETEIAEGDLSAHFLAAAQEERQIAHTGFVQFGEARFAATGFFGIGRNEDALLTEGELMTSRGEQGVFVAVGEQKGREKRLFAAVKK